MTPSKDYINAKAFRQISICESDLEKFKMPKKAIGRWALFIENGRFFNLRKVREDGYLMSDKNNNHQKILQRHFEEIYEREITADSVMADLSLNPRKRKWIKDLIEVFRNNESLNLIIRRMGVRDFIAQVIEDTTEIKDDNNSKKSKKLYSSIRSAVKTWNNRILNNYLEPYLERESYDYEND